MALDAAESPRKQVGTVYNYKLVAYNKLQHLFAVFILLSLTDLEDSLTILAFASLELQVSKGLTEFSYDTICNCRKRRSTVSDRRK